ncbi:MAG: hypothetical protein NTZ18_04080 [Candidatus Komeilibacteria bacterium]|nr:hypothetical protein [Candidatus Komeilibacteria bacterium]
MDLKKLPQAKLLIGAIFGIAGVLLLLVVFKVGLMVGVRKADFSCRWSDNYQNNFGGPRAGFLKGFGDRDFLEASGTFGQIIKLDGQNLVIKGQNDAEKIIVIDNETVIKRLNETVKFGDLKVDDYIVVIGEPNQGGQIEAKLIRVMPQPPQGGQMPPPNQNGMMPALPQN